MLRQMPRTHYPAGLLNDSQLLLNQPSGGMQCRNSRVRALRAVLVLPLLMGSALGGFGGTDSSPDKLREVVRSHAWGHHASCSCAIGPRDQGGVLDSRFKVYGTEGLRVVDASVFPRIPGFFIVSAIYMVGEKAADVILADACRKPM